MVGLCVFVFVGVVAFVFGIVCARVRFRLSFNVMCFLRVRLSVIAFVFAFVLVFDLVLGVGFVLVVVRVCV